MVKVGTQQSNTELMFKHVLENNDSTWNEESSGGVWVLDWNMNPLIFHWTKRLDIKPQTFHATMLIDRSLLIFGGTDLSTRERLG